jgi:RNA polymerase sigma-70 factor (ECF subfamily)
MLSEKLAVQDDQQLMLAIVNGSKEAFTILASRYTGQIIKFAYRYVGSRSDAEDVAQEAMIRLWRHAASWEPQGYSLRSWIYRITYNLCIDEIRKRKPVSELKYDNQAVAEGQPDSDVYQEQKDFMLNAALNELPERQRTAINLCVYQALSNQDAADTMGVSVEALESLLSRARRNLRKDIMNKS